MRRSNIDEPSSSSESGAGEVPTPEDEAPAPQESAADVAQPSSGVETQESGASGSQPPPSAMPAPSWGVRHPAPLPAPHLPRAGPSASPVPLQTRMNGRKHHSSSSDPASGATSRRSSLSDDVFSQGTGGTASTRLLDSSVSSASAAGEIAANGTTSSGNSRAPTVPLGSPSVSGDARPSSLSSETSPMSPLSPVESAETPSRTFTTARPPSQASSRTTSSLHSISAETYYSPARSGSTPSATDSEFKYVPSQTSPDTDSLATVPTEPCSPWHPEPLVSSEQMADMMRSPSKRLTEASDASIPEKKSRPDEGATTQDSEQPVAGPSRRVPPPSYAESISTPPHLSPILPRSEAKKSSKLKKLFLRLKPPAAYEKLKKEPTEPGSSDERSERPKMKITPKFLADALLRVVEALNVAPDPSSLPAEQTLELRRRKSDGTYVMTDPKAAQTGGRLKGLFSSIRNPGWRKPSKQDKDEEASSTSGGDQSHAHSLRPPLRQQGPQDFKRLHRSISPAVTGDPSALAQVSSEESSRKTSSDAEAPSQTTEETGTTGEPSLHEAWEMELWTAEGGVVTVDVAMYPPAARLATKEELSSDEELGVFDPLDAEDESTAVAVSQPSGDAGDTLSTTTFEALADDENSLGSVDTKLATSAAKLKVESEEVPHDSATVGADLPTPMEFVSEENNASGSGGVTCATPYSGTVSGESAHSAVASNLATPTNESEKTEDAGRSQTDETEPESS